MKSTIVACIHLPAGPGCRSHAGLPAALAALEKDLDAVVRGGADGVLLENENDKPHTIVVSKAQVAWLTRLSTEARRRTDLPLGIGVQRMDWEAALAIALAAQLDMVRLDVFVDRVRMGGEIVEVDPARIRAVRSDLGAESVELWTDVHVKHAELISTHALHESVEAAVAQGSSAILVTGTRTGEPPTLQDLAAARQATRGRAPVVIASGLRSDNAAELRAHADAAVVGTSLKDGERICLSQVQQVVRAWRS